MDIHVFLLHLQRSIQQSILTDSLCPVIPIIDKFGKGKWSTLRLLELFQCLRYNQYSFEDLQQIGQSLMLANRNLIRFYCILNPSLGTAILMESIKRDMYLLPHKTWHARNGSRQLTRTIAHLLYYIPLSIERDFTVHGCAFNKGWYDSFTLAARLLGAFRAPEEFVSSFVARNCHPNLFNVAIQAIKQTVGTPPLLVEAYQSHQILHPVAVRARRTDDSLEEVNQTAEGLDDAEFNAFIQQLSDELSEPPAKKNNLHRSSEAVVV